MNLTKLNTHAVAYAGLAIGATSMVGMFVASVTAFVKLVIAPSYLFTLGWACTHVKHDWKYPLQPHQATDADWMVIAQLAGALLAVLLTFFAFNILALLYAYYGRPKTVPADPTAPSV